MRFGLGLCILWALSSPVQAGNAAGMPYELWVSGQYTPLTFLVDPGLTEDSLYQTPSVHHAWAVGLGAGYHGHLATLQFMRSGEIFQCLFGCDYPEETTTQVQLLYGQRLTGRYGLLSAALGPALLYGVGRGNLISVEDNCGFLDCDATYERKTQSTGGLALQLEAALSPGVSNFAFGLAFNMNINRRNNAGALLLTASFGQVLPRALDEL